MTQNSLFLSITLSSLSPFPYSPFFSLTISFDTPYGLFCNSIPFHCPSQRPSPFFSPSIFAPIKLIVTLSLFLSPSLIMPRSPFHFGSKCNMIYPLINLHPYNLHYFTRARIHSVSETRSRSKVKKSSNTIFQYNLIHFVTMNKMIAPFDSLLPIVNNNN